MLPPTTLIFPAGDESTNYPIFRPSLLEKEDIQCAWSRPQACDPLKQLLVLALVAQLEEPDPDDLIEDYEELYTLPGFVPKLYEALKRWYTVKLPARQKNKWPALMAHEEVKELLTAVEKVKREDGDVDVEMGGSFAPSQSSSGGFRPEEVIEID